MALFTPISFFVPLEQTAWGDKIESEWANEWRSLWRRGGLSDFCDAACLLHTATAYFAYPVGIDRHSGNSREARERLGRVHVLLRCLVRTGTEWSVWEREHSWSSHLNPAHSLYGGRLTTTASPPPTDVVASSDGQTITSNTIALTTYLLMDTLKTLQWEGWLFYSVLCCGLVRVVYNVI